MLPISKTLQNVSHYAPTPSISEFMKIYKLWDQSFEKRLQICSSGEAQNTFCRNAMILFNNTHTRDVHKLEKNGKSVDLWSNLMSECK